MRITAIHMVFALFIVLVSICCANASETKKNNPHDEAGDCTVCHVASPDTLRSWFTFSSTKRELKDGPNRVCEKCHKIEPIPGGALWVGIGHATGKKTSVNHSKLPLAPDGTVTCATTCHDMHLGAGEKQQLLKHLRLPVNMLCISCHDR